jgi:hypothetical protein
MQASKSRDNGSNDYDSSSQPISSESIDSTQQQQHAAGAGRGSEQVNKSPLQLMHDQEITQTVEPVVLGLKPDWARIATQRTWKWCASTVPEQGLALSLFCTCTEQLL